MEFKWEFAETNMKRNFGVNANELDNKDSPIETFVREICQNSNDSAVTHPVRIEFKEFDMRSSDFPDIEKLRETMDYCSDAIKNIDNNNHARKIIDKKIAALKEETISVMRISDFNTKGLLGSNGDNSASPWHSLIYGKGISNKRSDAGGSKGRGKDSFFRMSEINTLFFSTRDIEGYEASIGVSMQINHYDSEGKKREDVGYYHKDNENYSDKQFSLDPSFVREEAGTDIFIPMFKKRNDDQFRMELAIIRDFFISIIEGNLEVKINNVIINKNTIYNVLDNLNPEDEKDIESVTNLMELIDCYHKGPTFKNKDYEIYIQKSDKFFKIVSVRAGMTISKEFHKLPRENCIGLVIIRSPSASELLLQSEDISHNAWNAENIEDANDRKKASILIHEIKEKIREIVNKLMEKEIGDKKDAMGLNRYIPVKNNETDVEVAQKEFLYDNIQKTATVKKKKPKQKTPKTSINEIKPTDPETNDSDEVSIWNDPVYVNDDQHPEHNPDSDKHDAAPGADESFKRAFKEKPANIGKIRTLSINPDSNRYKIMFDSKEKESIILETKILLDDENNSMPVKITNATDSEGNELTISENRIGPITSTTDRRNTVYFTLDYPIPCRLSIVGYKNRAGENNE